MTGDENLVPATPVDPPTPPEAPSDPPKEKTKIGGMIGGPFEMASKGIGTTVTGVADIVKLEVVVSAVCVLIPFLLIAGNGWVQQEHISAFYDMTKGQYFYFPLTMAAMLFVVNGVVREKKVVEDGVDVLKKNHWYNVILGGTLILVILFNHEDHWLIHNIGAVVFFLGNAAVFVLFTPKKELWFKVFLAVLMLGLLAGHFVFGWYSLFWGEAFSLWIIAAHFAFEALGWIE